MAGSETNAVVTLWARSNPGLVPSHLISQEGAAGFQRDEFLGNDFHVLFHDFLFIFVLSICQLAVLELASSHTIHHYFLFEYLGKVVPS